MLLFMDIRTRSGVDLFECGVHRYVEYPQFNVLLLSYCYNDGEIQTIDLTAPGAVIPEALEKAILDPNQIKVIHDSQFVRVCLSRFLGMHHGAYIDPEGWIDTSVIARYRGLPSEQNALAAFFGNPEDPAFVKDERKLVRLFSQPHEDPRTKSPVFYFPFEYPVDWDLYRSHCEHDIKVIRKLYIQMCMYGGPYGTMTKEDGVWLPKLWHEFYTSERINDRGIRVDIEFVNQIRPLINIFKARLNREFNIVCLKLSDLTGQPVPENLNSVTQLKAFTGFSDIGNKSLQEFIDTRKTDKDRKTRLLCRFCELRLILAKNSITKFDNIINNVCEDGRVRGVFLFGGASQTMRYSAKRVQLQNLPKNYFAAAEVDGILVSPDIINIKKRIRAGDVTVLDDLGDGFMDVAVQLIRSALIPERGNIYAVADFSAIEARMIAWLANEQWRIEAFKNGEDIYCSSASRMFNKPVVKHGENGDLRAIGKVTELACGYAGGVGALKQVGADKMGLSDDELKNMVNLWRKSSPNIVSLWWNLNECVKNALLSGRTFATCAYSSDPKSGLGPSVYIGAIKHDDGTIDLGVKLPSGRLLFYNNASLVDRFGNSITLTVPDANRAGLNKIKSNTTEILYHREDSKTPMRLSTNILVENIIQSMARDILQYSMENLESNGFNIVTHIHDEAVIELPRDDAGNVSLPDRLDDICRIMAEVPAWASSLPLRADGYLCCHYMKDCDGEIPKDVDLHKVLKDGLDMIDAEPRKDIGVSI